MVELPELGLKLGIWTQEASRSRYRPEGTTLCVGFLPIRFGSYFLPVFFCYLFLVSLFPVGPSAKDLTRYWAVGPVNLMFYVLQCLYTCVTFGRAFCRGNGAVAAGGEQQEQEQKEHQ